MYFVFVIIGGVVKSDKFQQMKQGQQMKQVSVFFFFCFISVGSHGHALGRSLRLPGEDEFQLDKQV